MKKAPQTGVRVSFGTLAKIKKLASAQKRSMTNYLETLVDREYEALDGTTMKKLYVKGVAVATIRPHGNKFIVVEHIPNMLDKAASNVGVFADKCWPGFIFDPDSDDTDGNAYID